MVSRRRLRISRKDPITQNAAWK